MHWQQSRCNIYELACPCTIRVSQKFNLLMYDPYKPLLYDQRTDSDENNTLYKIRNLLQHIKKYLRKRYCQLQFQILSQFFILSLHLPQNYTVESNCSFSMPFSTKFFDNVSFITKTDFIISTSHKFQLFRRRLQRLSVAFCYIYMLKRHQKQRFILFVTFERYQVEDHF